MMGRRSIREEVKSAQFAQIICWKKKGRYGGRNKAVSKEEWASASVVASMSNEFANRNPRAFS